MRMPLNSTVQTKRNKHQGRRTGRLPLRFFRRNFMRFIIMGINRRCPWMKDEVYGVFTDRRECYSYLETLKRGSLSGSISFYVKEE